MDALTLLLALATLQLSAHLPATAAQYKETTHCTDKVCLKVQFDALAISKGLYSADGAVCKGDSGYVRGTSNATCSSCVGVYQVCEQLVVKGQQLGQAAVKSSSESTSSCDNTQDKPAPYEAYGYGFLISVAISLTSLLAVFIVPFLKEGTTLGKFYKAIYAFMMASSSSALFCDAILIILPEVLFAREINGTIINSDDNVPASTVGELDHYQVLWVGSAMCAGMYLFFIWEFIYTTLYRNCKPPKPAVAEESFEERPYQWAVQRDLPHRLANRQRHRGEDLLLTQQQEQVTLRLQD
eukprot:Em0006g633a